MHNELIEWLSLAVSTVTLSIVVKLLSDLFLKIINVSNVYRWLIEQSVTEVVGLMNLLFVAYVTRVFFVLRIFNQ